MVSKARGPYLIYPQLETPPGREDFLGGKEFSVCEEWVFIDRDLPSL